MSGGVPPSGDDLVVVAEVVKAVGLRGEVKLYLLLDFHPPLLGSRFLRWDDGAPAPLRGDRPVAGGWVIHPATCDDRDGAEGLVGRELGFRREDYLAPDFPRPAGGLAFRFLGRPVVTAAGEDVGRVDEVRRYGAQLTLVVPRASGEVLIPAVAPILQADAGIAGPLVIDPPEGLLDANT